MNSSLEIRTYARGGRHRHTYAQFLFPLDGQIRVDMAGSAAPVQPAQGPTVDFHFKAMAEFVEAHRAEAGAEGAGP
jgi:hypothetical protein